MVEYLDWEVYRSPYEVITPPSDEEIQLSEHQQKAYDQLSGFYREGKYSTTLLYGVTGSGKTSVFLKLTRQVIADGKTVIVMVPEISPDPPDGGTFPPMLWQ